MICQRYAVRFPDPVLLAKLMIQTAEEKLNAFKTVTAYNSQNLEAKLFGERVDTVLGLARKEAYMTGIFWGMSGLTGNLALLCLLGYGEFALNFDLPRSDA